MYRFHFILYNMVLKLFKVIRSSWKSVWKASYFVYERQQLYISLKLMIYNCKNYNKLHTFSRLKYLFFFWPLFQFIWLNFEIYSLYINLFLVLTTVVLFFIRIYFYYYYSTIIILLCIIINVSITFLIIV